MNRSSPTAASAPSPLIYWAQLVRLPNVFTVIADVSAAFLLVAQGPNPVSRFALIVSAGIALYWAGMILNDLFDLDRDRQERPDRPLAAGHISLSAAKLAGWSLLIVGVVLATLSGHSSGGTANWIPTVIAIVLAAMVVAYDGPLKSTALAPAAMGACRMLSFLLGASAALSVEDGVLFPRYIIGIAIGFGVYVTGVTTMARHEASGGRRLLLATGLVITVIGIGLLALSPRTLAPQTFNGLNMWHTDPQRSFPLLIALLGLPVIARGIGAVADPTPGNVQRTIRVGILSIIPLAASFAFLGAGPGWGLGIFALVIPSIVLAARFRVT